MSARTVHPFPARMAPEIALNSIPQADQSQLTVIDPMCGSGTVLVAAIQKGHRAIGVDIDPLAVRMSRLSTLPIPSGEIESIATQMLAAARDKPGVEPWGDDIETDAFVNYWFGTDQRKELVALSSAISEVDSEVGRLAMELALSRIIITKSPKASLAADTAHSRPHRVRTESDYDVFAGFERSALQLARLLDARDYTGTASVSLGDARELSSVADGEADLAVTSPPYLNALDYLRGHKLALVWFGYKISDLRQRRRVSIGAERAPDSESDAQVGSIVDLIRADAVDADLLPEAMLERFAQDCIGFAVQLRRTVRDGGSAVLVVGNSTLRGNYIRNDLIAQLAMQQCGFELGDRYEREIPPSSRYMAISSRNGSRITNRMRNEVVLTMVG